MFMIRVYDKFGGRTWLDDGYIWDNLEEVNIRLQREVKDSTQRFGKNENTYTVIPIDFNNSSMNVYMPMTDKEVEISDITFKDNSKGFLVIGDYSISSFLHAWVEKHAVELGFSRHSIESCIVDGDTLTITVKEV